MAFNGKVALAILKLFLSGEADPNEMITSKILMPALGGVQRKA